MTTLISDLHRRRLEEIRKSLQELGNKESVFIKIELLFFEAINIAKSYGESAEQNGLLHALRNLQNDQYKKTGIATRKATEREFTIRRFILSLRKVLSGAS